MQYSYRQIINKEYHGVKHHNQMPMANRAAQFAPFAALTGYEEMVKEKSRQTERKRVLSEEQCELLNSTIHNIMLLLEQGNMPRICVTYFIQDDKKYGGKYVKYKGILRRIENNSSNVETNFYSAGKLIFANGTVIYFENIYDIDISKNT